MRKLIVTCTCGQRMQVSRSALGKMGRCTACGARFRVSPENTAPAKPTSQGRALREGVLSPPHYGVPPSEEAKQHFGRAVDLYTQHHYAEALAIFDALAREYPGNPDIQNGRQQCVAAMNRPSLAVPPRAQLPDGAELNTETVERVVLEKLLYGSTETVQLQAAEIAGRLLGIAVPVDKEKPDHEEPDDGHGRPLADEASPEQSE
jgi:hypothetical protein